MLIGKFSNTIPTTCEYYPFGSVLALTGSDDRYKYTGKELDQGYDISLYYVMARYYDAALGRFISPDAIRWYLNPYSYCADDPVNFVDIDGRDGSPVRNTAIEAAWLLAEKFVSDNYGKALGKAVGIVGDFATATPAGENSTADA